MIYIEVSLTSASIKPPWMFLKESTFTEPTWESQVPDTAAEEPIFESFFHYYWWLRTEDEMPVSAPWSSVIPHQGSGCSGWEVGQCPELIRKHSCHWGLWCPREMQICFCYCCCLFVWCCLTFFKAQYRKLGRKKKPDDILKIYIHNDAT